MSEEDQSVHQTRYSVLGKLLVNPGGDQPLDVDQCQIALLYAQPVPVNPNLEDEASTVRHLQLSWLPAPLICNEGNGR